MRRVEVRTFPTDDAAFREVAQTAAASTWAALAETHTAIADSRELIAAVEQKLRDRYPRAVIRFRSRLAAFENSQEEMLYAFRDGRIVA